MANLSTTYLGLNLKHPLVPSASPLSKNIDAIRRMEDNSASAVVLFSLFEEQIHYDSHLLHETLEQGTESFAESVNYLPDLKNYDIGPDKYLNLIQQAKRDTNIPIIASLNGSTLGGWMDYAQKIEQAGADALELNIYRLPTDPSISGAQVERELFEIVASVREQVKLPLAVKLSPFFSSLPHIAAQLKQLDVQGLVLFNRFYQADIDLETLDVVPKVNFSSPTDMLLPLRWTAILHGHVDMDIAISTGVQTATDVLKGVMAGANVTMMATELMLHGFRRIPEILQGLHQWMEEHEYESIKQMHGSMSLRHVADPAKYERAQYLRVLDSYKPPFVQPRSTAVASN